MLAIVNVTPDSFYDGGRYQEEQAAFSHIDALLTAGADFIDLGAESTRPGAPAIPAEEQWRRLQPALRYARSQGARVSIDTSCPEVAERCLDQGAEIINDVSCLAQTELASVVHKYQATLLLMHSRGSMTQMSGFSQYDPTAYRDVVQDVVTEWSQARDRAQACGLPPASIWFDPGIGFHKNAEQSFELIRRFAEFQTLHTVLTLGSSRKSFLSTLDQSSPSERLGGSLASCLYAVQQGAQLLRVHDVHTTRQALLADRKFREEVRLA